MPRRCSVPGCRSNYRDKCSNNKYVSCYGFPSDQQTSKKWLIAIDRRNFVPNYDNAVCAKHFDESSFLSEDMYRGANGELKVFKFAKPKLKNDAVPSLFLGGHLERIETMNLSAKKVDMPPTTCGDVLEVDDSKTCMDFVEVEMKDPEENVRGLADFTDNCVSSRMKTRRYLTRKTKNCDVGVADYICDYSSPYSHSSGKRGCFNSDHKKDIFKLDEQHPVNVRANFEKNGWGVSDSRNPPSTADSDKGVIGGKFVGISEDENNGVNDKICDDGDSTGGIPDVRNGVEENRSWVKMNTNQMKILSNRDVNSNDGISEVCCGNGVENKSSSNAEDSRNGHTNSLSISAVNLELRCGGQISPVDSSKNVQKFHCGISGGFCDESVENCGLMGARSRMVDVGVSRRDLEPSIGGKNCVEEIPEFLKNGGGFLGETVAKKGKSAENGDLMDANSRMVDVGVSPRDLGPRIGGKHCVEEIPEFLKNGGGFLGETVAKKGKSAENCGLMDANSRMVDVGVSPRDLGPRIGGKNYVKQNQEFQKNGDDFRGEKCVLGKKDGKLVFLDANSSVSAGNPKVKVDGENREDKDGGPSEDQEWEGGWLGKEELFRGLGLVPRGVLHDRSVDRRHCVIGQRRSEAAKGPPRSPSKTAVFYPPGTAMFDTERFIGEIQKRPAIYDVRSKVYSNRVAKLKYWHEVGKEMYKGWDALDQMERRTLVKELQIKWKSIRDHFMRQLKQNMNGEAPKKKKYVHFDQLQFLTANLGVKRPRHSYKPPKHEPEEEYMELTPELPEERHFSFMTSVERPDYDEHEVPVAAALLPQQPEDLSYHPKDLSYHHKELSYHKELEGDRMGNKMFLLSLLPIMERLPDHSNIRARLQLMEVLQTFVAHEDSSHRDFYNYHDEKQSCGDISQQQSTASHSDSDT